MMTLKSLFEKNKNIIINTDIDGFLSGIILQRYFNCKIVGFSNSWDCVWIDQEYEKSTKNALTDPIYIDLYVAHPSVICIEQHIIGYNDSHNKHIGSMGTKINPNIMRSNRTFLGDYFHKYPFGTIHFIIALMEKEGIQVKLPPLNSIPTQKTLDYHLTFGDIILRADDALFSSLGKYKSNTEEWWSWLLCLSKNAVSITSMINYIRNADPNQSFNVKKNTGIYFKDEFNCSGSDGAFNIITDNNGNLLSNILNYRDEICQMLDMTLDLPMKYITHRGVAATKSFKGTSLELDTSNNPNLYSYAFIFGPKSMKHNFSFTMDMH